MDVLDIYFVEHVKKAKDTSGVDDFLVEICQFALTHGDQTKASNLLERIIAHTQNERPEIAEMLAQSFFEKEIYSQAYRYFFKARNEKMIVAALEKVADEGYEKERDLFYARTCLDLLVRCD